MVEAAIPWKTIGMNPPAADTKIRGDIGALQSDDHGQRTLRRYYWSGKSQTIVSDTAYESRIFPALWGQFECLDAEKGNEAVPDAPDMLGK